MPHITVFEHAKAHTLRLERLGVAIHGQSFADQAVTEDLSRAYPPPLPGLFNIGMLHTSAEGYAAHPRYAPCEVGRLKTHGYDYWALGHVHARQILSEDPWIVFPGNLQGRHVNEPGEKGASLVTVTEGRVRSVEHRVLDVLRWASIDVPLDGAADEAEALTRVQSALESALRAAGSRPLAARVTLIGTTAAHAALSGDGLRDKVRNEAMGLSGEHRLWLEAVRLRTRAPTEPARSDALGRLLREVDSLSADPPPDLLGNYPGLMLDKLREALPDGHPLLDCTGEKLADILEQTRRRLHATLAGEA
jgi:DNA repair exonuclease SbcCD nuclease subunit